MTASRSRTREDVVKAASRLFAAQGYHGTSMRDLAREVGVLGSSLYSHIESKEDLLVEVVEIGAALFQASAAKALARGGDGAELLRSLVRGHIDVVLDHLDEARTFLFEADALDEVHRQRVVAARNDYETVFRAALETGRKDGSFRAGIDPKLAAILILSMLNAVERWYRPGGSLSRSALADAVVEFATRGIGSRI
ncbi:MAG: TetR/AcrR family transcriptional regulator [Acidimicrobiia bacterium]